MFLVYMLSVRLIISSLRKQEIQRRLGKVKGIIKGNDNQVRGADVKVAKTNAVVQKPVSRLYKIEGKEDNVNRGIAIKERRCKSGLRS